MLRQLRRLAQYRWCPGAVIPPETRVDASRFPDDEFPVSCPKCEYELRGLTDNCCPECGRPFDRGRLLVEQYLLLRDIPLTATGKLARTGAVIGWFVLIAGGICFGIILTRVDPLAINPSRFLPPFIFAFATAGILTFAGSVVWGRQLERYRATRKEKGQRVFDALDWNEPGFAGAQRLRWISLATSLGVVTFFLGITWVAKEPAEFWPNLVLSFLLAILCLHRAKELCSWGQRCRGS